MVKPGLLWLFLISTLSLLLQLVLCAGGKIVAVSLVTSWTLWELARRFFQSLLSSSWRSLFPNLLLHPTPWTENCLGMGFGQVIPCHDIVLKEFLLLRVSAQCAKVVPETAPWYQGKLLPKIEIHHSEPSEQVTQLCSRKLHEIIVHLKIEMPSSPISSHEIRGCKAHGKLSSVSSLLGCNTWSWIFCCHSRWSVQTPEKCSQKFVLGSTERPGFSKLGLYKTFSWKNGMYKILNGTIIS